MSTTESPPGRSYMVVRAGDFDSTGIVVWWELDGDTLLGAMTEAWTDTGLPDADLPPAPSEEVALRCAVQTLTGRRVLARSLAARGAWALVVEDVDGASDLKYGIKLRASIHEGSLVITPPTAPDADAIVKAYARAIVNLSPNAVSAWLIKLAHKCSAVSLRQRGGLYFVPAAHTAKWKAAIGALQAASDHRIYEMPALRTDEVVRAVLDGITRDVHGVVADVDASLTDDLSARSLRTRAAACQEAAQKVAQYEALLGQALPRLHDQLETLQSRIGAALLSQVR
jgi:hypothetical protein